MEEEFLEQDSQKLITKQLKLGEKKRQENSLRGQLINNGPTNKEVLLMPCRGFCLTSTK